MVDFKCCEFTLSTLIGYSARMEFSSSHLTQVTEFKMLNVTDKVGSAAKESHYIHYIIITLYQ